MRPDSIDIPPEPIKPEPLSRVRRARRKEREERREDLEDLARKRAGGREREESSSDTGAEVPEDRETAGSPAGRGRDGTRGRRLDIVV